MGEHKNFLTYSERYGSSLINGITRSYSINSQNKTGYRYTDNTTNPPKITTGGNSIITGIGAMPTKFYPSDSSSMFSRARCTYKNDISTPRYNRYSFGKKQLSRYSSSQHIHLKKINAIGKSSKGFRYDSGYIKTQPLAFSSINRNDVKKALHKVRSSGSVSPAKKGFYKLIR